MNNLWMKMWGTREVKKVRTMLSVFVALPRIMNFLTSFYMISSVKKTNSGYNSILAIPVRMSGMLMKNQENITNRQFIVRSMLKYSAYMHSYIPIWFVGSNECWVKMVNIFLYTQLIIMFWMSSFMMCTYPHTHTHTIALVRDLERSLCVVCVCVCEVVKLKLHDEMKSICNIGDYEKLNIWKADTAWHSCICDVLVCVCLSLSLVCISECWLRLFSACTHRLLRRDVCSFV